MMTFAWFTCPELQPTSKVNACPQEVNRYDGRHLNQTGINAAARRIAPYPNHPGRPRSSASLFATASGAVGRAKSHRSPFARQVVGGTVPAHGELAAIRPFTKRAVAAGSGSQPGIPSCQRYRHVVRRPE